MSRRWVDAEVQATLAASRLTAAKQQGEIDAARVGAGTAARKDDAPGNPLDNAAALRLDALGWLDRPAPPVTWLLDDVLALGEVGVLAAPGGTAKTWMLLQMAIGLASGTGFCDFGMAGPLWKPARPCPVLVLTAEERADDLHRRVAAIVNSLSLTGQTRGWLLAHFHIASLRGMDNLLVKRESGSLTWFQTPQADRIRALCSSIPGLGLAIVEPISRFRGGGENDAEPLHALVTWMGRVAMDSGASVLTAAHVQKSAKEQSDLIQEGVRGSGALVDNVRWAAMMRRMTGVEAERLGVPDKEKRGKIQVAIPKANNSSAQPNAWVEQMSNGVLRHISMMHTEPREKPRANDDEYEDVVTRVIAFLRKHPREYSATGLSDRTGGQAGLFRCGQKALRAILARAIEEGRIRVDDEGRGKGCCSCDGVLRPVRGAAAGR